MIFGIFNREQNVLAEVYRLVDASLAARAPTGVSMLARTFERLLDDRETEKERSSGELYAFTTQQIEQMRERLIQLAFADLGRIKSTVFDLGLEHDVQRYAQSRTQNFVLDAKSAVAEVAVRHHKSGRALEQFCSQPQALFLFRTRSP
jgi:hypothetical protein